MYIFVSPFSTVMSQILTLSIRLHCLYLSLPITFPYYTKNYSQTPLHTSAKLPILLFPFPAGLFLPPPWPLGTSPLQRCVNPQTSTEDQLRRMA